jgi:glycosyltransferase involved in cell wall biosynthesis
MRLDVVIPAHNEESRIEGTLRAYRERCAGPDVRFMVALDHCTDGTAGIVRRHAVEDPRVQLFEYPKLGKGGVIMETFRHCDAELVGFVDADGATPPGELLRLAEAAATTGAAIGSRRHPAAILPASRTRSRRLTSAGFSALVRRMFGLSYSDTQCGAKVFRRELIERALPLLSSRDFLFDVDLIVIAHKLGHRPAEVPTIWIDRDGSKLDATADGKRMAASTLRLWLHHRLLPVEAEPASEAREATPDAVAVAPPPSSPIPIRPRPRPDVALVSPCPPPGEVHAGHSGVASYTGNLVRELAAAGAEVTVVAPVEDEEESVELNRGVRVERSFRRGPGALPTAIRAAIATGAPIVHLQHEQFLFGGPSSVPGLLPALGMVRAAGRGPVVTMHQVVDPGDVDGDLVRLHRLRAPASVARMALATVQGGIERLAGQVIVHEPAFTRSVPGATVIHHGLETEPGAPTREQARAELGLDGEFVALCFGFIAPYKGLEPALEAAELAGDEVRLVVAGGDHPRLGGRDSYGDDLRERFSTAARFTGYVPDRDVSAWFSAADVALFMYPQPFSASGALALALAHGTPPLLSPALARAAGAPAELTIAPEPEPLALRLVELARRPDRLEQLRAGGRALARDRSWPAVARRHLELYEEVKDAGGTDHGALRAA